MLVAVCDTPLGPLAAGATLRQIGRADRLSELDFELPLAGGTHEAVVTTSANFNRDFLIQTRIKSNYAMALIFGASGSSYGYSFFIDEAGYFAVYKEGYHPEVILDWQRSSAINSGFNDVEIEQINDYWYGYINGVKVFQTPARVLSGSKTGFMVLANTTGYADYLTVKW